MKLKRWTSGADRERVLGAYLTELLTLDWPSLASSAPDQWGLWPIDALTTLRGDVVVVPSFYVPHDDADLCVIVDASSSYPIHRVVIDGFALREGCRPEAMTDAEWAALNF